MLPSPYSISCISRVYITVVLMPRELDRAIGFNDSIIRVTDMIR